MKLPLVSVIVPIYNSEIYLYRCIRSIQKQSYKNLEIILVNDGSIDRSGKIIANIEPTDLRIKVIHKINGGISSARNAGLNSMNGEYVIFVDSDDFLHRECIRNLLKLCLRRHCQMVSCNLEIGDQSDFRRCKSKKSKFFIYNRKDAFLSRKIKAGVVGKLYHKSLFSKLRFPESDHFNYEDEALIYKLMYGSKWIAYIDQNYYYYFQNNNSTTRKINHYLSTDFIQVFHQRIIFFKYRDKELMDLSREYYSISLMLFYIKCKKDPYNKNDLYEILQEYEKLYCKIMKNNITPLLYKTILSIFYLAPDCCSWIINYLHLR